VVRGECVRVLSGCGPRIGVDGRVGETRDVVQQCMPHFFSNRVRLIKVEIPLNRDIQFGAEFVSHPTHPHSIDAVDSGYACGHVFNLLDK
jgi:hypothetical protein